MAPSGAAETALWRAEKNIPDISHRVLTLQFCALEDAGLVTRKVFAEVPPRVEYTATTKACGLSEVFFAICAWKKKYPK